MYEIHANLNRGLILYTDASTPAGTDGRLVASGGRLLGCRWRSRGRSCGRRRRSWQRLAFTCPDRARRGQDAAGDAKWRGPTAQTKCADLDAFTTVQENV